MDRGNRRQLECLRMVDSWPYAIVTPILFVRVRARLRLTLPAPLWELLGHLFGGLYLIQLVLGLEVQYPKRSRICAAPRRLQHAGTLRTASLWQQESDYHSTHCFR
jgi:hypothetical protein